MEIAFLTIYTADISRSVEFYTQVLGFQMVRRYTPEPKTEIAFLRDSRGSEIELIQRKGSPVFRGEGVSLGFFVEDLDAMEKTLRASQAAIVLGPIVLPGGDRLLKARDRDGFELGFIQRRR